MLRVATPLLLMLAVAVLGLGATSPPAGKSLLCAKCGLEITGPYVEVEGALLHRTCFRCAACGKPILGRFLTIDGKWLHPTCFVCAACGKPLEGTYRDRDGAYYHPACWDERFLPRCAVCGKPISGPYATFEGKAYHDACYASAKAPTCALCGQKIVGDFRSNWWHESIHAEHASRVCFACGRYAAAGSSRELPDGRIECDACTRDAVRDLARAQELLAQALGILADNGITLGTRSRRVPLELIDRNELRKRAGPAGDVSGLIESTAWTDSERSTPVLGKSRIYVLTELPTDMFLGVVAHELFHLWQHEHRAFGGAPSWREGSAELAAGLVYERLASDPARFHLELMEKSEDTVYGTGYREAKRFLSDAGMKKFLDEVVRRGAEPEP